jgi:dolichol-phosphate mannosyltransferase
MRETRGRHADICILLPVLNEIGNIERLVKGIAAALADRKYAVCFVDDGSRDGTAEFLEEAVQRSGGRLHLIRRRKTRRGSQRGSALHTALMWALKETDCRVVVEMDGDLSHRPEELSAGIDLVESGRADVAIASKYVRGSLVTNRPVQRRVVSKVCSFAVRLLLSARIRDYSNGYRFYSRAAAEAVAATHIRYGSPIYLSEVMGIWLSRGMKMVEFPSHYVGRNEGISKLRVMDLVKAGMAVFEIAARLHATGFAPARAAEATPPAASAAPRRPEAAAPSARVAVALVWALAAGLSAYSLCLLLFLPRPLEIDELGLYNPVYMQLRYGRMTYPVHHFPSAMVVHPPVRYCEVASLMRLGLPLFYAEGLGVCLLGIVGAWVIALARFSLPTKLGLLLGLVSGPLFLYGLPHPTYGLRPDTQLALALFLGLVLLEDARLRGWDSRRLLWGSLVLTYGSGIHYFAWPALFGLVVYALWARASLPPSRRRAATGAVAAGAALVGVPYLALFVLPNLGSIVRITAEIQTRGSWLAPITRHYEEYAAWVWYGLRQTNSTLHLAVLPVLYSRVPVFLVGAALLFLRRETRGIAAASLPLCLFVFACSQGKSRGYLMPEVMIFFSAVGVWVGEGAAWLAGRAVRSAAQPAAALVVGLLMLSSVLWGNTPVHAMRLSLGPHRYEMDLARAASKRIVGENALVAARIGLWYISGAGHWYDPAPDLLWKRGGSCPDLRRYFSRFDCVAEHQHMSSTTLNWRLESIPSWYVSRVLRLRGFFASDLSTTATFLVFDTRGSRRVTGYVEESHRLLRFEQAPSGRYVFATMVCPFESDPPTDRFGLPHFNAMFLPKAELGNPHRSYLPRARPGDPQKAVVTALLARREFEARRRSLCRSCTLVDAVPGDLTPVDARRLLRWLQTHDRPIRFHSDLSCAVARKPDIGLCHTGPPPQPQGLGFALYRVVGPWMPPRVRRFMKALPVVRDLAAKVTRQREAERRAE